MTPDRRESTAVALRRAFDRSFAEARGAAGPALESLLAIRVGGDPYAVRLQDVASLHADRKVVPLPGRLPELMGLVALRGALVPVYDLRVLLAQAVGPASRWIFVAHAQHPVAFAFDVFEAHVHTAASNLSTSDAGAVLRTADGVRPVIHTASLIDAIGRRAHLPPPEKEH